ncbi:pilus assembly protein TadG-related protein [Pendulispora albinea]|uniref:Pilus assembly protein TadG-related protein n=1 Tax=Pendulispora albinea TaxID=2741071 RepID=A0ABZ2LP47_9BACT
MSRRARTRVRQRGATSVFFALLLVFVVGGILALVVDVGHFWLVRSELQNAADAAALAGVRDLNGLATQFPFAITSAQTYGGANRADGTAVTVPLTDVTLGKWDLTNKTFTPTLLKAHTVNAVRVTTRRTAATGNAVEAYFGPLLGIEEQDITATAIAVGGGPSATCGFVLALPSCSVLDAFGNLNCNATLSFNSNGNNAAFTLLSLTVPNTPDLECAMWCTLNSLLGVQLPLLGGSCSCSPGGCKSTSVKTQIAISNGTNLSSSMIVYIQSALALSPNGLRVDLPIFDVPLCPSGNLSNVQTVAGYVKTRITGATGAPNKSISVSVDCAATTSSRPSQELFGYKSTEVYLVR